MQKLRPLHPFITAIHLPSFWMLTQYDTLSPHYQLCESPPTYRPRRAQYHGLRVTTCFSYVIRGIVRGIHELQLELQKQCSNLSLTDASVAVVVVSGNTNMCAVPSMHFALYTQSEYIPTMHFALYTHQSQYTPTMQSALPRTLMVLFQSSPPLPGRTTYNTHHP